MRNRRRGIFFISVLVTSLLLAMLVGAALQSGIWGLKRGQNQGDVAAARRAAAGGVEYALARLRDNPQWKANTAKTTTVNEPGFFVVEEYGNVVGVLDCGGQVSQFRIRFNYNDGTPGGDGMANASSSMGIPSGLVSFNNMLANGVAEVPRADGPGNSVPSSPNVYTNIPGHSVFLVVEGRCGDWLAGADPANPNPAPPVMGGYSASQVESVYKVANASGGGTAAVGASAGNFKATVGTSNKKDNLTLDSASGSVVGRLRSRANLTVAGGQSGEYNLVAGKGGGEYRALGTHSSNPDPSVVNHAETPSDSLYPIPWSQVHTADGSNVLPAGTYVFWDDGSLHYFDMSVADYYNFMANPLNHGNAGQAVNLPSTVVASSSNSGANLKAKLTITGDTLVAAATNTTSLAVIPQKGVDAGPGAGGGAPSAASIASAISSGTSLITQTTWNMPLSSQITVTAPAGYNLLNNVAQWAAGQGVGTYSSGNWNLPVGGALNNLGSAGAVGNIDLAGLGLLTSQISLYIAANPNDPNWASFAGAMSMAASTRREEIPGVSSLARPQNIEVKFDAPGNGSATLTGPGDITLASKVSGNGASITAEGNLNLLGLGVDLSALTNPTEGVSLYSKKDVTISTYDKGSGGKYHDVSLKGVVYAWGNFKALLGSNSLAESKWGKLKLTGAMIAYGKDPADLVSSTTAGDIEVLARDAALKYDPAYLLDFSNTLPANISMLRVRWSEN